VAGLREESDKGALGMNEQELSLPEILFKTIHHFVPKFFDALKAVPDPRNPDFITYPLEEELLIGVIVFLLKLQSRRNLKFELNTPEFIQNLYGVTKMFFYDKKIPETIPHGDTLNYVLKKIPPEHLEPIRAVILQALLRKKCLEDQRLFNLYYPVAVDGTGCWLFRTKHCEHCLTRVSSSGQTLYYHPVLEAKLVCPNGLACSIATEFIENPEELKLKKQDCELKAFYRLSHKLKAKFPQLRICLLLDALYAAEPVFQRCQENHWRYLITFKPGHMSATYKEYESLKKISPENKWVVNQKGMIQQTFHWVNDINFQNRSLNAFECQEIQMDTKTLFVFLTNFNVDKDNVQSLSYFGRCRWKIENEGFNVQKNGGYGLEHAFSLNNNAMKNFYLLMQIAHIFNQLIEKGSLLANRICKTIGSLRVLSKKLLASLTEKCIDFQRLEKILQNRIQIRFNSS
jgi:hypothetical protein